MKNKIIDLRFQYDDELVSGIFFTEDSDKIRTNLENNLPKTKHYKLRNEIPRIIKKNGYSILTKRFKNKYIQFKIQKLCDLDELIELYDLGMDKELYIEILKTLYTASYKAHSDFFTI